MGREPELAIQLRLMHWHLFFEKAGVEKGNCALTSIKPNLGHALAASGVVSLISLLLAMKNKNNSGRNSL